MSDKSTLEIRKIIGNRFAIAAHMVRPDDIKTLMSYMTLGDLKDLTSDEVDAFVAEGKRNGLFRMAPRG